MAKRQARRRDAEASSEVVACAVVDELLWPTLLTANAVVVMLSMLPKHTSV
jgi:hypothetical protein